MESYRSIFITKAALFEGAAFFAIVGIMLTGSLVSIAMAVIVWIALILQHPAVYKVARELGIKAEELV